jgi:cytochrome c
LTVTVRLPHRLYGLPGTWETGYLSAPPRKRRPRPLIFSSRFAGLWSRSMDSFELNKILGAILATCLFVISINIAAGALFTAPKPAKPGYEIAVAERPAGGGGAAAPAQDEPLEKRFASATPERGETAAKKCQACHTFGKGEPNRVGPNLYGVVGRPKASVNGFNYSAAMKAKGGNWTPDELDHFLTNPKAYIPGTNMSFAGLPRGSERADVITFLNTKSDSPAQLPKAAEAPARSQTAAR